MTISPDGIFLLDSELVGVRRAVGLQALSHMAAAFSADIVRAVYSANPAAIGCGLVTV